MSCGYILKLHAPSTLCTPSLSLLLVECPNLASKSCSPKKQATKDHVGATRRAQNAKGYGENFRYLILESIWDICA